MTMKTSNCRVYGLHHMSHLFIIESLFSHTPKNQSNTAGQQAGPPDNDIGMRVKCQNGNVYPIVQLFYN